MNNSPQTQVPGELSFEDLIAECPPLDAAQIEQIYGHHEEEEAREALVGHAAFVAIRRAAQRGAEL